MGIEVDMSVGPFCPNCGYSVDYSELDETWDCPRCFANSEDEDEDEE